MIGWHFLSTLALLFLAASVSSAKGEELVDVGVAVAPQGGLGRFSVGFYSNSIIPLTAAVQVEISYDSKNAPIPAKAEGTPDCASNPAAGKSDTTFAFVPDGCSGTGCTSVRATVESLTDSSPIPQVPEGVEIFACSVHPPFGAVPSTYLLTVVGVMGWDQLGNPVSMSVSDGFVDVRKSTPGDCDGNGIVPISEVIRAVKAALGAAPSECPTADLNQDGTVDISELLAIVNTALSCDISWPCFFQSGH
jgi:hypothetical protein